MFEIFGALRARLGAPARIATQDTTLLRRVAATVILALAGTAAAPSLAAPASVEGTLEILIEDHPQTERTRHFLKTDKGRIELRMPRGAPALRSGARVRATGNLSGNLLELSDSGSTSLAVTAAAPAAIVAGEQKLAVLLVNFTDDTQQPFTPAQAQDLVFNQGNGFVRENSFQTAWLAGNVFGWLTLPIARTCLTSEIATAATQAAGAAGINLANYPRRMYVFPRNDACVWSGVGSVGGASSEAWINGRFELKVVMHELGHNLGLEHSRALDCDATALGSTCTTQEYGDVADTMGNTRAGHFNAFQKERLGWLAGGTTPPITTAGASGSYALGAYESADMQAKALKIPRGIDPVTGARTWYYVEYRRALGFDAVLASIYGSNLVNGLLIRTATDGDARSSMLLDMTAGSIPTFDMGDAALVYGNVFNDAATGVTINLETADAAGATVRVTLNTPTASCTRANPAVALAAGGTLVAGATAQLAVTITNKDASACSASAFAAQAALPSGWSGTVSPSSLTLAPGASANATLSVTAAANAAAGAYTVGVGVANSQSPAFTGAASGSLTVGSAIAATVATNKALYTRNETVRMSALVQSGGQPVAGAGVQFVVIRADGSTVNVAASTDSTGLAKASYRVSRRDVGGLWTLRGTASLGNSSASGSSAFSVQ